MGNKQFLSAHRAQIADPAPSIYMQNHILLWMIQYQELSDHYSSMSDHYEKSLTDILWYLDRAIVSVEEESEPISRILNSAKISHRIKPFQSMWKKCKREEISDVNDIPEKVEDIIGIRIATANKVEARDLFDFFRSKSTWFCPITGDPQFVPYTIQDKNKYSLETGYQAYHISFKFDQRYYRQEICHWPTEIQIMSQLWQFWANYSRDYFYARSGGATTKLLPFNIAISKVLDSADDLMSATTDFLHGEIEEPTPIEVVQNIQESSGNGAVTIQELREWFKMNVTTYFGPKAKVPIYLFLSKITEELNLYDVSLKRLEEILQSREITSSYNMILHESRIAFLPPYQGILCSVLLSLGWETKKVLEAVNQELGLLGIHLKALE